MIGFDRGRRARWAALTLIVTGLVASCGVPLPGRPEVTLVPLPADRLVLSVELDSPEADELYAALAGPALAVYGDGRVISYREDEARMNIPAAYHLATAGPDAAAQLAVDAEASGLFDPGVEYGYPNPTDLPATVVTLHGASGPRTVVVLGFSDMFDRDVSLGERRLRRQLQALLDRAGTMRGDAALLDYQVERVAVRELKPDYKSDLDTVGPIWSGPEPGTFLKPTGQGYGVEACGVLTGAAARTAYAKALDNPGQVWTVGPKQRQLVVVPILPGWQPCPV